VIGHVRGGDAASRGGVDGADAWEQGQRPSLRGTGGGHGGVGLGCVQGSRGDQCETGETGKEGSEEIHK
jgi:hypothetical protein